MSCSSKIQQILANWEDVQFMNLKINEQLYNSSLILNVDTKCTFQTTQLMDQSMSFSEFQQKSLVEKIRIQRKNEYTFVKIKKSQNFKVFLKQNHVGYKCGQCSKIYLDIEVGKQRLAGHIKGQHFKLGVSQDQDESQDQEEKQQYNQNNEIIQILEEEQYINKRKNVFEIQEFFFD